MDPPGYAFQTPVIYLPQSSCQLEQAWAVPTHTIAFHCFSFSFFCLFLFLFFVFSFAPLCWLSYTQTPGNNQLLKYSDQPVRHQRSCRGIMGKFLRKYRNESYTNQMQDLAVLPRTSLHVVRALALLKDSGIGRFLYYS